KKSRRIIGLNVISEELYFETADLTNELLEKGSFFKNVPKLNISQETQSPKLQIAYILLNMFLPLYSLFLTFLFLN
ncbi:TPA: hypothetical protein QFN59_002681, partial [Enterococcus faecium]